MELLPLIWCGIIAFGVIMYVLLGGFDLGIGIMSIFVQDPKERDLMFTTILPVWDGNQTWLVFGGAALYGAFPLAFSTIMPIMYMPMLIMVIALLFRGISFEFRLKANKTKRVWEICIFLGSLFAIIAQGLTLGCFVQGFNLTTNAAGNYMPQWFTLFGVACALGLICGYVLLGANFLIIKTTDRLQKNFYKISSMMQYCILLGFIMVSVWSPYLDHNIKARWFDPHNMPYLAILPILTLSFFGLHWWAIRNKREHLPFWCVIAMFILCYIGFIISSYPYIVPRSITYLDAAADRSSLLFMLMGACVMFPPLLYYTYHSYQVFKGKVTEPFGY